MPGTARNRRTKTADTESVNETPETTPDSVDTTEQPETTPDSVDTTEQPDASVTPISAAPSFSVTTEAPRITRGRNSQNPFIELLKSSYVDMYFEPTDDEPHGRWLSGPVDNVKAVRRQLRSGAQQLSIGYESRVTMDSGDNSDQDGPGTVWFRGAPLSPRTKDGNDTADTDESADNDKN